MKYFLIGIKGTGLASLASFLIKEGHEVIGSDVENDFYTSVLLKGIRIYPLTYISKDADIIIYSVAYSHLIKNCDIPSYTYVEYLALQSKKQLTIGISGTHGKSSISVITSSLMKDMKLKTASIYGSVLLGDDCVYYQGKDALVLEACEYKGHFLSYSLDVLVINNIDLDHVDCFSSLEDVNECFKKRILSLNRNAIVLYHSSIKGLVEVIKFYREDITYISYGPRADYYISSSFEGFCINQSLSSHFTTKTKEEKLLDNYLAAALTVACLILKLDKKCINKESINALLDLIVPKLSNFKGLMARNEIVCFDKGITYIDDYAHHPEEIKTFYRQARKEYGNRRLVAIFAPHTASRTEKFLSEFVTSLASFDAVFIQNVYQSARGDSSSRNLSYELYKKLEKKVFKTRFSNLSAVVYLPNDEIKTLASFLLENDVCITLGASDNRKLIKEIVKERNKI